MLQNMQHYLTKGEIAPPKTYKNNFIHHYDYFFTIKKTVFAI